VHALVVGRLPVILTGPATSRRSGPGEPARSCWVIGRSAHPAGPCPAAPGVANRRRNIR